MTQIQTTKLSDSLRNIAASAEMEGGRAFHRQRQKFAI